MSHSGSWKEEWGPHPLASLTWNVVSAIGSEGRMSKAGVLPSSDVSPLPGVKDSLVFSLQLSQGTSPSH